MPSVLIFHSDHTKKFAELIAEHFNKFRLARVANPPTEEIISINCEEDIVIGIGGGSVIDTAKIVAREKRCIAVPTTAAGACMTPYATIWGRQKRSVNTLKPIVVFDPEITFELPEHVRQSTLFDALSHSVESFWSSDATGASRLYSKIAISMLCECLNGYGNNALLVMAGNIAGKAISIARTNVVHAASYPLTTEYGIEHGTACGMLLPAFIEYMSCKDIPALFCKNSSEEVASMLREKFQPRPIKGFNADVISEKIMKYEKIHQGPKDISKKTMFELLRDIEEER